MLTFSKLSIPVAKNVGSFLQAHISLYLAVEFRIGWVDKSIRVL